MSNLTLTHTVLRGDARLIKVPNARFLDSTLTLCLHGACAVTLRVPPHLKAGLGNGVQMLPISLSAEGREVTLYHRDGDLSVFRNLDRATAKSKLTLHLISHQSGTVANLHHSSAYT